VTLLLLLLTLAVLAVTAAVIAGVLDARMPDPVSTVPPVSLSADPLTPESLEAVRFSPALRGYRMDQVDAVLARVIEELAARDDQIHSLTRRLSLTLESGTGSLPEDQQL
jgi:DivIVA domain-containing protein